MFASPGVRVGVYEIVGPAGKGGMGEVYRARDTRLGRLVAIKFVAAELHENVSAEARLAREARLASSLNHPGIVSVFDVGSHDGRPYVVMEWIDGMPLSSRIASGQLPIREAIDLAWQVGDALAAAHEAGIVHRDLKPQNVMLTADGRAKIVDFGLSRSYARSADDPTVTLDAITQGGIVLGTPGYTAPEQIRAEHAEPQADQFALGAMLYELLTNARAFRKNTSVETLSAILVDEPPPIESRRPDVPESVRSIVRRCLHKRPGDRYVSTRDLARELREVLDTIVAETRHLPKGRTPMAGLTRIAVAAAIVAIVASIGVWSWRARVAPSPAAPAMPAVRHIVVMPFANVTKDAGDQVFADGLVETLSSSLGALERFQDALRVVPASEVRGGRVTTVKEAQQAFGATLAITGSIQRLSSTTRLTLNLVDATGLVQLASRTMDLGTSREALTQDSIISAVTGLLALELEPVAQRALTAGGTSVPIAYELFVQGRGFLLRFDRGVENVDRAIDALTRAVAADAGYALAHSALGAAYWRKYEFDKQASWIDKAVAQCERALAIDNRVASVHVTLAIIASGRGRYEEAVAVSQRAIELEPAAGEGYRELARAYEALNRVDDAETTYRRAVAARADDWSVHNALGTFYLLRGRLPEAEGAFKQVLTLTPDNTRGFNNLGSTYFRMGRAEEAAQMWERSVAIRPTTVATSNLGTYYFERGRYGEAATAIERALTLAPNDRRVWRNLASAQYWAPGQRERSAATYRKAAELAEAARQVNPRDPGLLAELADSYSMLGRRQDAIDAATAFASMRSSDATAVFAIAGAYEQLGDRASALQWLERALAAGYPKKSVEQSPGLRELRKDSNFARLINRS
jgi:tetratricopeptide (TPR) repeat protein